MNNYLIFNHLKKSKIEKRVVDFFIKNPNPQKQSYYIFDSQKVYEKIKIWDKYFGFIKPYYAVKSNPNNHIIKILDKNNFNFDCASVNEIKNVNNLNISSDRIIYANPIKSFHELNRFKKLRDKPVLTTIDNNTQLDILNKHNIDLNYLVRLFVDSKDASCMFFDKYGCNLDNLPDLLKNVNKDNFKGFAFHVGSDNKNINSYLSAIEKTKEAIKISDNLNLETQIIDIGGGLSCELSFNDLNELSNMYKKNFYGNYQLIAEPGRFFCEEAFHLVSYIIDKKTNNKNIYYLDDSIYQSFNCLHFDHLTYTKGEKGELSKIYGRTCDGTDIIFDDIFLPNIDIGTALIFPNMGAYTLSASSNFNGFHSHKVKVLTN